MTKNEIKKMVNTCNNYYSCALCPYNPEDISRFIGDRWKGGCPDYDRKLVYAMGKGYGNVSEYKTERKMLRSQIKVLKQRLNDKYIEIDNLNRDYRNAFERLKAQQREIDGLRAENACLLKACEEQFTFDTTENKKYSIFNSVRKEFAEKVKEEVYPFLQAEMYNKKHFITGDSVSDKLLENQNIGILKAQDVLSKWFKVKIDELLKEYEK